MGSRACLDLSAGKELPAAGKTCGIVRSLAHTSSSSGFSSSVVEWSVLVGPCHHGMARPQVADRGTASDKEGSCE